MTKAIYAGSFDPFTNGHLEVLQKAYVLFDNIHICLAKNANKGQRLLPVETMQHLIQQVLQERGLYEKCQVVLCHTLLSDYCKEQDIHYTIRGIRNATDFLYEEPMTEVNRFLAPDLETVYFRASPEFSPLSSSLVRELLFYKKYEKVSQLIPKNIFDALCK